MHVPPIHVSDLPPIHKALTILCMDSSTSRLTAPASPPRLNAAACLNARMPETAPCSRCADACPAGALAIHDGPPALDAEVCTGCTGCVTVCPTDALAHPRVRPAAWLAGARQRLAEGSKRIHAACDAAGSARADIRVPCHAAWDVTLLAGLAAEGVRELVLDGIHACQGCPLRHGQAMMEQTRREWDALSQALGVKMALEDGKDADGETGDGTNAPANPAPADTAQAARAPKEPARRAFFRNLLPSLAQGAAVAAAQIGQSAREALREDAGNETTGEDDLPWRMQLFLHALPHLNPNFTPVPVMDGFPFGAIQATAACTACGDCVPACPTGALSVRPFGNNAILELAADACTGCGLCIQACPEQALERLPAVSLPALLTERPRPLIMVAAGQRGRQPTSQSGGR